MVDPFPPGGGCVRRREQPLLLWMNRRADDVTMCTGASAVPLGGPVRTGPAPADRAGIEPQSVRDHITGLGRRHDDEHSEDLDVSLGLLFVYGQLARLRDTGEGAARRHGFFGFLASGPGPRLFLALSRAGAARFLRAGMSVETDEPRRVYRAGGAGAPGSGPKCPGRGAAPRALAGPYPRPAADLPARRPSPHPGGPGDGAPQHPPAGALLATVL